MLYRHTFGRIHGGGLGIIFKNKILLCWMHFVNRPTEYVRLPSYLLSTSINITIATIVFNNIGSKINSNEYIDSSYRGKPNTHIKYVFIPYKHLAEKKKKKILSFVSRKDSKVVTVNTRSVLKD